MLTYKNDDNVGDHVLYPVEVVQYNPPQHVALTESIPKAYTVDW